MSLILAAAAFGCSDSPKTTVDPDAAAPDSGNPDSGDSAVTAVCGDNSVGAGEECDDGNTTSWDGCSSTCENEKAMRISAASIPAAGPEGCESALGAALSAPARLAIGNRIAEQLGSTPYLLLSILDASSPTLEDDSSIRIAWLTSTTGDTALFDYVVDASSVTGNEPNIAFTGGIAEGLANTSGANVVIPFSAVADLAIHGARIVETSIEANTSGAIPTYRVPNNSGHFCGTVQIATMANIPNPITTLVPGANQPPSCDTNAVPTNQITAADLIAGGASLGSTALFTATAPDVNVDGDTAVEELILATGQNCQPVVVACKDADGTMIDGHDCMLDARIADGWSTVVDFTAVNARFVAR